VVAAPAVTRTASVPVVTGASSTLARTNPARVA
jgi:hypothetical protein